MTKKDTKIQRYTKKDKLKYIEKTHAHFLFAKNHGGRDNWWYPTEYTIAYNVKMNAFGRIETLRQYLSKTQNEYCSDVALSRHIENEREMQCEYLRSSVLGLNDKIIVDVNFAGRSNGWIEVEYTNPLKYIGDDADSIPDDLIHEVYAKLKEVEKVEAKVSKLIAKRHKEYNKYVDTKAYYKDLAENLIDDEMIKDEYRAKIAELKMKL